MGRFATSNCAAVELEESIDKALRRWVRDGEPVAIACSGGGDSLVLAKAMWRWAQRGPHSLILIHVDHGLHAHAVDFAQKVRQFGHAHQIPVFVVAVDVDRNQASLENAARTARYRALEGCADAQGVHWIALAHTASDQAETVVMRILRGTSIRGLQAMAECRDRFVRPLLGVSRHQVEAYAKRHALCPVTDPMNRDDRFFRVRVRRRILPILRQENPRIDQALCRLANAAAEEQAIRDWASRQALADAMIRTNVWSAARLAAAPEAVTKQALGAMAISAGAGPLSARHLPGAVRPCDNTRGWERKRSICPVLSCGASTTRYRCCVCQPNAKRPIHHRLRFVVPSGPYRVRRWVPGDRMCPARLHGRSRKLSDLFH